MAATARQAAPTPTTSRYQDGDYVLYRNPSLYWTGRPGHTAVYRVCSSRVFAGTTHYVLVSQTGGPDVHGADPAYMRLLPPEDCMRDIDTASLDGPARGLLAGSTAWLAAQARQAIEQ